MALLRWDIATSRAVVVTLDDYCGGGCGLFGSCVGIGDGVIIPGVGPPPGMAHGTAVPGPG